MAFNVGDVLRGSDYEIHPKYGKRPDLEVLAVNEDGSKWTLGRFTCACGETRDIHAGDWFQVRQCTTCKPTKAKKAKVDGEPNTPKAVLKNVQKAANSMQSQMQEKLESLRKLGRA